MCKAPVWVGVGILAPAGPLTDFFVSWIQAMCFRGGVYNMVSFGSGGWQPPRQEFQVEME